MKKYDELLKRAEIFEKLAVYGNRNEFLKAISQLRPNLLDPRPGTNEMGAEELNELAKSQGRPALTPGWENTSLIPKYNAPSNQVPFGPPSNLAGPTKTTPATAPQTTNPKYWGTKGQVDLIKDIQQFLETSLGKDALAPYGADGKWGTISQKALSRWLGNGNGSLNSEALRQLAKYVPSVQSYYQTLPESQRPDPYNPDSNVVEVTNVKPPANLGF